MSTSQLKIAAGKQDNMVESGLQQSKQNEYNPNAEVEPLEFDNIAKGRAAPTQPTMKIQRAAAKKGANTAHDDMRD